MRCRSCYKTKRETGKSKKENWGEREGEQVGGEKQSEREGMSERQRK